MPVIELDMILALLNRADKLHAAASRLFEKIISGELSNVSIPASAYLEYELVMRSRGYSSRGIVDDIISLRSIPGLGEVPLTSSVLLSASRLREAYGLTYFDSLHASSALHHDGAIISVDGDYRRVPMLKVMDPREL